MGFSFSGCCLFVLLARLPVRYRFVRSGFRLRAAMRLLFGRLCLMLPEQSLFRRRTLLLLVLQRRHLDRSRKRSLNIDRFVTQGNRPPDFVINR